jgi:hypothetical protein
VKTETIYYRLATLVLRLALIAALFSAGWFIYTKLPHRELNSSPQGLLTNLQIVLQTNDRTQLDIPVEIYPIDIVAVRHEYFAERRAGKRFEEFLQERMNGRAPVTARLDQQGQTTVAISPGNWWVHAQLSGNEDLEWRLPVTVGGNKQVVELTSQNAYTRAKSF